MKIKNIIIRPGQSFFLALVGFVFLFPSISFGSLYSEAECTYLYSTCTGTSPVAYSNPNLVPLTNQPHWGIDADGYFTWVQASAGWSPGDYTTFYRANSTCQVKAMYKNSGDPTWYQVGYLNFSTNYYFASPVTFPDTTPPTLGVCPDPCGNAWDDKVEACGGAAEYVINWDQATCTGECDDCQKKQDELTVECGSAGVASWNPISCFGKCNCPENAESNATTICADYGGLAYFDNDLCVGVCQSCVATEPECDYGLISYNYDDCTYECDSCASRASGCPFECEFSCSGSIGFDLVSDCKCEDNPDEPPLPDPDENPDDTDDPADPADPVDDSPDGDGTNDNAILDKIERNTLATQREVDRVGDILQTELNKANAGLNDIENDIERGNGLLEGIGEGLHDIENAIDEGNDAIEDGNGLLQDIVDNTAPIQDIENYLTDGELTQADIDGIVSGFESDLDTAWSDSETDMNTSVMTDINDTDVVVDSDISVFKSIATALLPASRTCIDLDLSFQDKELIISCDHNGPVKAIFSYIVYVFTILGIFALIHKEMRPE